MSPALSSGYRIVLVMVLGAESCDPSTVNTGIPASFSFLKVRIVFSSVTLDGRAWWKRSPAIIIKSGLISSVFSTSSRKALSKSCLLVSKPYCE